jgi:hypothetical protein
MSDSTGVSDPIRHHLTGLIRSRRFAPSGPNNVPDLAARISLVPRRKRQY